MHSSALTSRKIPCSNKENQQRYKESKKISLSPKRNTCKLSFLSLPICCNHHTTRFIQDLKVLLRFRWSLELMYGQVGSVTSPFQSIVAIIITLIQICFILSHVIIQTLTFHSIHLEGPLFHHFSFSF